MSTLSEQQGPWHPFRSGMPVPTNAIDDDPQFHICFNTQWMPAVMTALKLLTRPEAYVGSNADVQAAVQGAHDLMANVLDGCPPLISGPNWYLNYDLNDGFVDNDAWNTPQFGTTLSGDKYAQYDLVMWGNTTQIPDVTIRGLAVSDSSSVGGNFSIVHVSNVSDPAGQGFVLTTLDCLGNTVVHSGFTPADFPGTYRNMRIVGGNSTVFIIKLRIYANYVCGSA